MEKGIHYRTGGKLTHAGCECLPEGKDIPYIVIEKIDYVEQAEINGRQERNMWLATFAKNPYTNLPMVLNATNRKRIAKLYPNCNGYINLLKNIPVRLTREQCRDVQDGGTTWGLRISKIPATKPQPKEPHQKQKQVLTRNNAEVWQVTVQFLKKNGIASIERVKEIYDMSPDIEKQLISEAQEGAA